MTVDAFKYSDGYTPGGYACGQCSRNSCKLWRKYNVMLDHQSLFCAECAAKNQKKSISGMNAAGSTDGHDLIGWLIPAVPTEDGSTYWGYTSVPDDGVAWWKALPNAADRPNHDSQMLQELHGHVAQLCIKLGADPQVVPCDVWHLAGQIEQLQSDLRVLAECWDRLGRDATAGWEHTRVAHADAARDRVLYPKRGLS